MPVVSRFSGIVIRMYLRQKEHNPPHLHAVYRDYTGMFSLSDGEMFEGDMPVKEQKLVTKFIEHYRNRLMTMWETQKIEVLPPIG